MRYTKCWFDKYYSVQQYCIILSLLCAFVRYQIIQTTGRMLCVIVEQAPTILEDDVFPSTEMSYCIQAILYMYIHVHCTYTDWTRYHRERNNLTYFCDTEINIECVFECVVPFRRRPKLYSVQ